MSSLAKYWKKLRKFLDRKFQRLLTTIEESGKETKPNKNNFNYN